jgi:hypothetical protein
MAFLGLAQTAAATVVGNPLITLYENGTGSLVFATASNNLTGVLAPDPGPGGRASALTYNLLGPPGLVAGDLFLTDSGGGTSDVIRFNPAGTGNPGYPASAVFYSDIDGTNQLADTGLPDANYANTVTLAEESLPSVCPGCVGVTYTPTSGQPGYVDGFGVSYDIISDTTPEPSTAFLLIGGVIFVLSLFYRRTRSA